MKKNKLSSFNGFLVAIITVIVVLTGCENNKNIITQITITTDSKDVKSASFRGKNKLWERSDRIFRDEDGIIFYQPEIATNNFFISNISSVGGTFYFYLEKGDHLQLNIRKNSLKIVGETRAANQNRLIKEIYKVRKTIYNKFLLNKNELNHVQSKELNKLYTQIDALVLKFMKNKKKYSKRFLSFVKLDNAYFRIKNDLKMPNYRLKTYHDFSKEEIVILNKCLSDSKNEDAILSLSYRQVLNAYIDYLRIHDPKSILVNGKDWLKNEATIAQYLPLGSTRTYVIANNLLRILYYNAKREKYLEVVKNNAGEWSSFILELAAAQKGKKGRKVYNAPVDYPKIEGLDPKGKIVSLSSLKGQWVYVDIWATWCGPCIFEIPYLKKMKQNLKDYNVAFVGISVDKEKDREKLLAMIKEKKLKGVQIHKPIINTVYSQFGIKGIPHFAIISPEGKLYLNKAPTPSTGISERLLKSLAGKR
tara:strand:- start:19578 stop:21008 length:1431 start_codon:yes stop_codon:yes gene_type:complete